MSISNAARLNCKPRNFESQHNSINAWLGQSKEEDNERLAWGQAVWQWFVNQAKEHQKDLEEMPINMGGVRLTCQYLMWVLEDTKIDDRLLRENTNTAKDEWLLWKNSTMAEFARTCAREVERDRLEQGVPEIRKTLMKSVTKKDEGYLKSSQILLKMGGRENGEAPTDTGIKVTVVERYVKEKGEIKPVVVGAHLNTNVQIPQTKIEKEIKVLSKGKTDESDPVRGGDSDPVGGIEEVEDYGSEQDFT